VSAELAAEPNVVTDAQWRRLSPRMLLVHPVKEVGRALPALLAVLIAGSSSGQGELWGLAGAAVVAVLALSRWFTTRYRVGADQVQIREGVLRRRTLAARLDRVRTVDVTSHFLHRALGLARVEIGTGVSDRKGRSVLRLDGLPAADAARLRAELLHRAPAAVGSLPSAGTAVHPDGSPVPGGSVAPTGGPQPAVYEPAGEVEIARLRLSWVRYAPFTLSGIFTGLAIAGFGWRLVSESGVDLEQLGPIHQAVHQLDRVSLAVAVVEVVTAGVVFVVVASIVRYLLAFWDFRLTRHPGGSFHVSRGLVTTRATSIDVSRLRGVGLTEPLPLRLAGGCRTVAIATGLEVGRGASPSGRGGTVLLPDAPRSEALRVAGDVLGRADLGNAELASHGPVARQRRYTRAVGAAIGLVVATGLGWWVFGLSGADWLLVLLLLPASALLAADRAGNLGHVVRDGYLVTQSGSLVRARAVLETEAIIGWNFRQSFFQRRARVATLVATTAAGRQSYRLLDLSLAEAHAVVTECQPGLLLEFSGCRPGSS
jgi:putative membrane protein